jgi:hypothetical protein
MGCYGRFERLMAILLGSLSGGMQPSAPTIGTATAVDDVSATVAFTASSYIGKGTITYTATSSPGGLTGTSATSPITVAGLTTGTAYTFTVVGNTNYGVASEASAASNSITPATQTAYESIQTIYLSSGSQLTLSFSSIPATFKHLQLRCSLRSLRTNDIASTFRIRFNGDTGNNTIYNRLMNNGSGAATGFIAFPDQLVYIYNACISNQSAPTSFFSPLVVDIYNYSSSSIYKVYDSISGIPYASTDQRTGKGMGAWASTTAINSLEFTTDDGSNFAQYSHIGLYGIKG